MPNYDSTARVPFKHGGSVTPKWTQPPGKRRRTDKKSRTRGSRKKINPQWLEEKYNVNVLKKGGRTKRQAAASEIFKAKALEKAGKIGPGAGHPLNPFRIIAEGRSSGFSGYPQKSTYEKALEKHKKEFPTLVENIKYDKKKDFKKVKRIHKRSKKAHGGSIDDKLRKLGKEIKANPLPSKTKSLLKQLKKSYARRKFKKGGFPIRTSKLKRGADQEFTLQKGVSAAPIKQSKTSSLKEHAKTWPPKGMTIKQDSQKAFEGAIKKGLKNPKDYMYMHSKGGKDFFKHIGTRKYESFKKGGRADKKWIQKATKGMRKDKPCTGKKFGSATCPPGSKRYNLAQTFKKMARSKHASGGLVRYI
jgi:hypothetical protein